MVLNSVDISKTSPVPQAQQERNQSLDAAAENGTAQINGAWRQTLKGNKFQIKDAVLFNLETPTEKRVSTLSGSPRTRCSSKQVPLVR